MKIYLDSIGCRLNQSEIERMAMEFRKAGHVIVEDASQANLVVVNTCAVTSAASADSRQRVRHAAQAGSISIFVTGCWATINPQIAIDLPSVKAVINNDKKDSLVAKILGITDQNPQTEIIARKALPGQHQRTRAFIKVQDGCDNFCTYCVTRIARGPSRSESLEQVLNDIQSAIMGGTKEVVLTGAQLGSWGRDLKTPQRLVELIAKILQSTDIPRLRLSSLEPWEIDQDFISLFQNQRFCHHLHLPLQSGSENTIRRMSRKITPLQYHRLVEKLRLACPDIAITTDIIVGFPGETDQDFLESLEFVKNQKFSGGHVFPFSSHPQTPAGHLPDLIPDKIKKVRSAVMREEFEHMAMEYRTLFKEKKKYILWEKVIQKENDLWMLEGLSDNYLRVSTTAPKNLWNILSNVRIINCENKILKGEIQPDGIIS